MANRLFQGIIYEMKENVDREIGVIDMNSTVIACSELSKIGETDFTPRIMITEGTNMLRQGGKTYKIVLCEGRPENVVYVDGEDDLARQLVSVIAISLEGIKELYDEKYDRANFIKNVVLDNILPSDIYVKARELHFNSDVSRCVLIIRLLSENVTSAFELLQNIFPDKQKDFLFTTSENDILLVKEVRPGIESKDLEVMARAIADTLTSEYMIKSMIGIGTIVTGVKELATSFKEAQVSLEVSKVFDTDKNVISYDSLGIARLIYQLPTTLCEMFLREVFKRGSIESLDQETLFTIQKFFENNLNVSETSRKLFVHRNTLVYRLEKIKKLTGLDLREFDHAIVFKVALMVKKYLAASPVKY